MMRNGQTSIEFMMMFSIIIFTTMSVSAAMAVTTAQADYLQRSSQVEVIGYKIAGFVNQYFYNYGIMYSYFDVDKALFGTGAALDLSKVGGKDATRIEMPYLYINLRDNATQGKEGRYLDEPLMINLLVDATSKRDITGKFNIDISYVKNLLVWLLSPNTRANNLYQDAMEDKWW